MLCSSDRKFTVYKCPVRGEKQMPWGQIDARCLGHRLQETACPPPSRSWTQRCKPVASRRRRREPCSHFVAEPPVDRCKDGNLHFVVFATSNILESFFIGQQPVEGATLLRKARAPPKCKFFIWLVLHDRCWTAARRKKHGLQDDDSCSLLTGT